MKKKYSLLSLIFTLFVITNEFQGLATVYNIVPNSIFVLSNLTIIILGMIMYFVFLGEIFKRFKILFFLNSIMIVFFCINIIVNRVSLNEVFLFIKDVTFLIFGIWCIYFTQSKSELEMVKKVLIKIFYIQIPMLIVQFIYHTINKSLYSGTYEDLVVAFFGFAKTGEIGFLSAILGIFLYKEYVMRNNVGSLIKIGILFLVQFLVSAKISIIIWILGVALINKKYKIVINLKQIVFIIMLSGVMLLTKNYFREGNMINSQNINYEFIQLQRFKEGTNRAGLGRVTAFYAISTDLASEKKYIWIGHGSGTTRSMGESLKGRDSYIESSSRYFNVFSNVISRLYYEIGIIGVVLLIAYFIYFLSISNNIKHKFVILTLLISLPYINGIYSGLICMFFSIIMVEILKEKIIPLNKNIVS